MFSENKTTNIMLHIILILLIIIVIISFFNIYASKRYYEHMSSLNVEEDINFVDYNSENFDSKNSSVYETNVIGTFDSPFENPNELGEVMIIMYHGVDESIDDDNVYHRSVAGFREDLERIYNENYYIISLKDYLNNEIDVPFGYTPIILTFDDGLSSSFSLEEDEYGELLPTKDCAVYILNEYRVKYNRPNATATFFINTKNSPFYGFGTDEERLKYLVNKGYDLGNHTYSHTLMQDMTPEEIQNEVGLTEKYVREILPDYEMIALAYPYGGLPPEDNLSYSLNGSFENSTYNYKVGLLASSTNNTTNIYNLEFDIYNVPRVRGTNIATYDLGWYFDYYNEHPEFRFISDGDKNTITLQKSSGNIDLLNYDMISGKNLIILN